MKRIVNLPRYIQITAILLLAVGGAVLAFRWPLTEPRLFINPLKTSAITTAGNLNQVIINELTREEEAKQKAEAPKTKEFTPAPAKKPDPSPQPPKYVGAHIRLGYLYDPNLINTTDGGINVASPGWFAVKSNGSIVDKGDADTVQKIHARGISVVPFINSYEGNPLAPLLKDPQSRSGLAEAIAALVAKYNFEGINIDFEDPAIPRDALNAFMQKLADRLHGMGKLCSIAVNARTSDRETWLDRYDYRYLGAIADYVVIMAYDEHYRNGPPGPVSSIGWFRQVCTYAANTIPRNKVVMGIPLYGRHWLNGTGGSGVSYSYIINNLLKPAGASPAMHSTFGVPYAVYQAADGMHEIYFENPESVRLKAIEVNNFGFRGAAFWRLGQEDLNVWPVIKDILK